MKIFVNVLTSLRLIFSILLIFLIGKISSITFLILVSILFLTDSLDGKLARKYKVQTFFGSALDALSDKVLCICLLIPLIKLSSYFYLILIMEFVIFLVNLTGKLMKKYVKSNKVGKFKMWVISLCIIIGYINLFYNDFYIILDIFCIITLFFQLLATVEYIIYLFNQKCKVKLKDKKQKLSYVLFNTDYYLKIDKEN